MVGEPVGVKGYAAIVERVFGRMNWLQLNEADAGAGLPIVTLTPEALSHPEVRQFAVRSPLLRDIGANDERLWRIRGQHVVGFDPLARQTSSPFSKGGWGGDILYGRSVPAALVIGSTGRRIEVKSVPPGVVPIPALTEIGVAGTGSGAVFQGFRFTDERGEALAELRLVGRKAVLFPSQAASADLLAETEAGVRRGGTQPLILAEGGAVRFVRDGQPVGELFRFAPTARSLSTYRPFAPRVSDATLGRFGQAIEAAVVAARLPDDEDVPLTLDAGIQLDMQASLETAAQTLVVGPRRQPFRAAALLMDTLSGELLALASYPSGLQQADGQAPQAWLERNHNFTALPIGSVAKPLVSVAILTQYPDLASLRVTAEAEFDHVLGIDMGEMQIDEATNVPSPIGFSDYLKHSSNKYATALMLMALARDPYAPGPCATEPYWLRGVELRRAPTFLVRRAPPPCGDRLVAFNGRLSSILQGSAARPNWLSVLRNAFDMPRIEEASPSYDPGLWRPLPDRSDAGERPFLAVSPERENFHLGTIGELHNDYVNLILGGVHSRWTTVKVAESMSQILTGRLTPAMLVRGSRLSERSPPIPLWQAARFSVLQGMEEVLRPGGTAAMLAPQVAAVRAAAPPGEVLRLFAKTGTPSLARSIPVPARAALAELGDQGILTLDAGGRLVVRMRRQGETEAQALGRSPEARRAAQRRNLTTSALAAELQALRRLLAIAPRPLRGPDGRLDLPSSRIVDRAPGGGRINGGVLALVAARYCPGTTDVSRPIAAMTLVVNVQARGPINPAVGLARAWLNPQSQLVRRLYATRGRCAGGLPQ
ncbi:MAG TPA: hypothetical protein VF759_09690 [Allosphingosinicella sp.]